LHQDIEDMAVLIDRPPEIVPLTTNREKDLIQMPLITSLGSCTSSLRINAMGLSVAAKMA